MINNFSRMLLARLWIVALASIPIQQAAGAEHPELADFISATVVLESSLEVKNVDIYEVLIFHYYPLVEGHREPRCGIERIRIVHGCGISPSLDGLSIRTKGYRHNRQSYEAYEFTCDLQRQSHDHWRLTVVDAVVKGPNQVNREYELIVKENDRLDIDHSFGRDTVSVVSFSGKSSAEEPDGLWIHDHIAFRGDSREQVKTLPLDCPHIRIPLVGE